MCICCGSAKPREVLEASYLPSSLNSTQIGPSPVDHLLRCVAPGSHILIWTSYYRHIYIWRQISIDAKRLQVMRNTISQFRRILDISRLVRFQSTWTIPIDIHDTLHKTSLLVSGDQ